MNFYFAPMEGITGYIYRNAYQMYFGNIDKYFSPFIVANQKSKLRTRECKDVLPENNKGLVLVPQILTNKAEDFVHTSNELKQYGYHEVNLNLGCPSGTVVSKYRGAGFLAKPKELDEFLEKIFTASITEISVKTRIGMCHPEEFYELIEIYNQYPIKELIIHPRTREDFYNNQPDWKVFGDAIGLSKNPVCYNGDIVSENDYKTFADEFPTIDTLMIGRGLLKNPFLINNIHKNHTLDQKLLREFHDKIYRDYQEELSGDRNVLFKMKELWFYLIQLFEDSEKYAKKIRKAEKLGVYEDVVDKLFGEEETKG